MLSAMARPQRKVDKAVASNAECLLGAKERSVCGAIQEAKELQCSVFKVRKEVQTWAAACHFGARFWTGSLLQWLVDNARAGHLEILASFKHLMSDETTMSSLSAWDPKGPAEDDLFPALPAPGPAAPALDDIPQTEFVASDEDQDEHEDLGGAGPTKIVQSAFDIGILFRSTSSGRHHFWMVPLVCPLQTCDKINGETQYALWQLTENIPGEAARQLMNIPSEPEQQLASIPGEAALRPALGHHHYEVGCLDRAGYNDRCCLKKAQEDTAQPTIMLACDSHIASQASGHVIQMVPGVFSGCVHLGITSRQGGHHKMLQDVLDEVLLTSIKPREGPIPTSQHPWSIRRDTLLALILPATRRGRQRFRILRQALTGNLESEQIDWYHGLSRPPTKLQVKNYAKKLRKNLLPTKLKLVKTNRWLRTLAPIGQIALLANTHNLLARAVVRWLAMIQNKRKPPLRTTMDFDNAEVTLQGINLSHAEDDVEVVRPVTPADWAKWNKQEQRGALRFVAQHPRAVLLAIMISLQAMVRLQRDAEKIDSDRFELQQMRNAAKGSESRTRVEHLALGEMIKPFFERTQEMLFSDSPWDLIPKHWRTRGFKNLVLSMNEAQECSIEQMMVSEHLGWPLWLFRLPTERFEENFVEGVLGTCPKLRGDFANRILAKFGEDGEEPTPEQLKDDRVALELRCLSMLIRKTIVRIERGHTSIRRRLVSRCQTHHQRLTDASADHVLKASRQILQQRKRKTKVVNPKKRKKRRGGGGHQRAAFSEVLQELGAGGIQGSVTRRRLNNNEQR